MTRYRLAAGLSTLVLVGATLIGARHASPPVALATVAIPRPDHVVIVIFENKKYSDIAGSASAPYLNTLAAQGATFTQSYGVTHPSQPNYIALFSGSTQGVTGDLCPKTFTNKANLATQLAAAGLSFTGYSESMPSDGFTGCTAPKYARKHNPWVDFTNVPASANRTFAAFPTDYNTLPTVSIVVPNLCNDMHNCAILAGDKWTKAKLSAYATWAMTHNSLLIVTFDEDDKTSVNQIFTVMVGQHVRPGSYGEQINHYTVLRTIEDAYDLAPLGNAAAAVPLTDCWQ
jgi:acid phosphatase